MKLNWNKFFRKVVKVVCEFVKILISCLTDSISFSKAN